MFRIIIIFYYGQYVKFNFLKVMLLYLLNWGHIREFLRAATKIRPHVVLDTIATGEALEVKDGVKVPIKGQCQKCGYISSQPICKACMLLEGLY